MKNHSLPKQKHNNFIVTSFFHKKQNDDYIKYIFFTYLCGLKKIIQNISI